MSDSIYSSLFIILLFLWAALSLIYWSFRLGITPTPTSPSVKKSLLTLIPQQVCGEIHELGSGWGHLLPAIKKQCPNNTLNAHERSPLPRLFSQILTLLFKTPVNISSQDIFEVDLSKSGLVFCYLYPGAMKKLATHFKSTLPENCWIISHTFRLPGWTPIKTIQANDLYKTPIYLYKKSANSATILK
ncbi:MAG: hypothetical protein QS721_06775 [Candidatus Endonucleobacter sp. (ex Gigantidas childressi)]|nr:hypothetical protein [Candidatus Endonucleobacter sp. (ex Gigantidas childressi)]